jgi:hypothetical protein
VFVRTEDTWFFAASIAAILGIALFGGWFAVGGVRRRR